MKKKQMKWTLKDKYKWFITKRTLIRCLKEMLNELTSEDASPGDIISVQIEIVKKDDSRYQERLLEAQEQNKGSVV